MLDSIKIKECNLEKPMLFIVRLKVVYVFHGRSKGELPSQVDMVLLARPVFLN